MSSLVLKDEDSIRLKMQSIRSQIVDIEILTKTKYDSNTPTMVRDTIEQLKQNIFDLDISLTNETV